LSDLCTNCGFCCSRLFFTWVELGDDEQASIPPPIQLNAKSEKKLGFTLPCPALQDCKCTVYDQRPRACRIFECDLLKDLKEGRTNLESSQAVVAETKRLVD
jgi:Fe-S-cluster containining protein